MGSIKTLNELNFPIYFSCWVQPMIVLLHHWDRSFTPMALLLYEAYFRHMRKAAEDHKLHWIRQKLDLPLLVSTDSAEFESCLDSFPAPPLCVLVEASIPFDDWPHPDIHPKVTTVLYAEAAGGRLVLMDENGPVSAAGKVRHYLTVQVDRSVLMRSVAKVGKETGKFFFFRFADESGVAADAGRIRSCAREYIEFADYSLRDGHSFLRSMAETAGRLRDGELDLTETYEDFFGFTFAPWLHAVLFNTRVLFADRAAVRQLESLSDRMHILHLSSMKEVVKTGTFSRKHSLQTAELIDDAASVIGGRYRSVLAAGIDPIAERLSRPVADGHRLRWQE